MLNDLIIKLNQAHSHTDLQISMVFAVIENTKSISKAICQWLYRIPMVIRAKEGIMNIICSKTVFSHLYQTFVQPVTTT